MMKIWTKAVPLIALLIMIVLNFHPYSIADPKYRCRSEWNNEIDMSCNPNTHSPCNTGYNGIVDACCVEVEWGACDWKGFVSKPVYNMVNGICGTLSVCWYYQQPRCYGGSPTGPAGWSNEAPDCS